MSETPDGASSERDDADADERQQIADVQEQLDAQADGDGLAAEAGAGEETGLTEG
ncbi:hypothetical protein [Nocardioides pantholopis]|uniref:hypothetical protein n=1 Tax=Nocardioides pantholopis TaxID=2483798 RepID=UPI0013DDD08C|nr:hypothetical protein [Nocardioides pantholopis]